MELPLCAERTLLKLQNLVCTFPNNTIQNDNNDHDGEMINICNNMEELNGYISEIADCLLVLKSQMMEESYSFKLIDDVSNIISSMLNQFDIKIFKKFISGLMNEVRILDMNKLTAEIIANIERLNAVSGKDIILLLGTTGAGKTTTILYLAGCDMEIVSVKNNDRRRGSGGIHHIKARTYAGPELESFVSSHELKSETKYVNVFNIPTEQGGYFTLCDTPGFNDTAGAESDISNGVGVVNALRTCKSIRPVILFCKDDIGSKLEGIKQVATILGKLFGASEEVISSFTYAFTRYKNNEDEEIYDKLVGKLRAMQEQEKLIPFYYRFLQDMVLKTDPARYGENESDPHNDPIVVRPLDGRHSELIQKILAVPPILHPANFIHNFASTQSLYILKSQITLHMKTIRLSISACRIDIVGYKLYELKVLQSSLQLPECINAYEEALAETIQARDSYATSFIEFLNLCEIEGRDFEADQLARAINALDNFLAFEPIREVHTPEYPDLIDYASLNLRNATTSCVRHFKANFVTQKLLLPDEESVRKTIQICANELRKLAMLYHSIHTWLEGRSHLGQTSLLGLLASSYNEVVSSCIMILSEVAQQAKVFAEYFDLKNAGHCLDLLDLTIVTFTGLLSAPDIDTIIQIRDSASQFVIHIIEQQINDVLSSFDVNTMISSELVASWHGLLCTLEDIRQLKLLHHHISLDLIDNALTNLLSHAQSVAILKIKVLSETLSVSKLDASVDFNWIVDGILGIESFISFPAIHVLCSMSLHRLVEEIRKAIEYYAGYLNTQIEVCRSSPSTADYSIATICWIKLQLASMQPVLKQLGAYDNQFKICKDMTDKFIIELEIECRSNLPTYSSDLAYYQKFITKINSAFHLVGYVLDSIHLLKELVLHHVISECMKCKDIFVSILSSPQLYSTLAESDVEAFKNSVLFVIISSTNILHEPYKVDTVVKLRSKLRSLSDTNVCFNIYKDDFLQLYQELVEMSCEPHDDDIKLYLQSGITNPHLAVKLAEFVCNDNNNAGDWRSFLDICGEFIANAPTNDTPIVKSSFSNKPSLYNPNKGALCSRCGKSGHKLRDCHAQKCADCTGKLLLKTHHDCHVRKSRDTSLAMSSTTGSAQQVELSVNMNHLDLVIEMKELLSNLIVANENAVNEILSYDFELLSSPHNMQNSSGYISSMSTIFSRLVSLLTLYEETCSQLILLDDSIFSNLFHKIPASVCNTWSSEQGLLVLFMDNVSARLVECFQQSDLNLIEDVLNFIQNLCSLDRYLLPAVGKSFQQIYMSSRGKYLAMINEKADKQRQISLAVSSWSFDELDILLRDAHLPNFIAEQKSLYQKLALTLEKARYTVEHLNFSASASFETLRNLLVDDLKTMNLAREYAFKYLETAELAVELNDKLSQIHEGLQRSFVTYILSIDMLVENNLFYEAESILVNVLSSAEYFMNVPSAADNSGYTDFSDFLLNSCIPARRASIRKQIDAHMVEIDLANQFIAPTFIFNELKKAEKYSSMYRDDYNAMATLIKTQALQILQMEHIYDAESQHAVITYLRNLSNHLPQDVYALFDGDILKCEIELQAQHDSAREEVQRNMAINNLRINIDRMNTAFYNNQSQIVNEYLSVISESILISCSSYLASIHKNDIDAFPAIIQSCNDWGYLMLILQEFQDHGDRNQYNFLASLKSTICRHLYAPSYTKMAHFGQKRLAICISISKIRDQLLDKIMSCLATLDNADNIKTICDQFELFSLFLTHEFTCERQSDNDLFLSLHQSAPLNFRQRLLHCVDLYIKHLSTFNDYLTNALESVVVEDLSWWMETSQYLSSFYAKADIFINTPSCSTFFPSFVTALKDCCRYNEGKKRFAEVVIQLRDTVMQPYTTLPRTISSNSIDRNEFYNAISAHFDKLRHLRPLGPHIDASIVNVSDVELEIRGHIKFQTTSFREEAENLFAKIPTDDIDVYLRFSTLCDNLRSIAENIADIGLSSHAVNAKKKIDETFRDMIMNGKLKPIADVIDDNRKVILYILTMRQIAEYIPAYKIFIQSQYDVMLERIKKIDITRLVKIGNLLGEDATNTLARKIIDEAPALKGYKLLDRNKKTRTISIENVIESLDVPRPQVCDDKRLHHEYDMFEKLYWELVDKGRYGSSIQQTLEDIVNKAREIGSRNTQNVIKRARELIAYLFAYWTLENVLSNGSIQENGNREANNSDGDNNIEDDKLSLLQPHPAQVIALFQLFGIGNRSMTNNNNPVTLGSHFNHLIQVGTGEGKSVILGIASATLAILGYQVHCACYSEYLSDRDRKAFSGLFSAFGVDMYIQYGTFNAICEKYINQRGEVRHQVESLVMQAPNDLHELASHSRDLILLIDEVDVFFKEDFLGQKYIPLASIRSPEITALFHYLWDHKSNANLLRFRTFQRTAVYRNCMRRFQHCRELIDDCIKSVLFDLNLFLTTTHVYEFNKVKHLVGYKLHDGISYNKSEGYLTTFAYFEQFSEPKRAISLRQLDDKLDFIVGCGSYSYAEIPKNYKCIMGVTGTLASLGDVENDLLRDEYKINLKSFIPSVYGANNFHFQGDTVDDFIVDDVTKFYLLIRNEIDKRMLSKDGISKARALLVFFENSTILLDFYRHNILRDIQHDVKILIESTPNDEKDSIIGSAATTGSITFLTRIFGRGTDFVCYDDQLQQNGGVHVISTFFSEDLSEEIQIMGRTARQGSVGSFSFILKNQDLEDNFDVDCIEMRRSGKLYSTVDLSRRDLFSKHTTAVIQKCDELIVEHTESLAFIDCLVNNSDVFSFLTSRNMAPPIACSNKSRTIILMDSTGSMSHCLRQCQESVKDMIAKTLDLLSNHQISTIIEMKFVAYRNYSSMEAILEHSDWLSDASALSDFISNIDEQGGQGNEAIEVALQYVNGQDEVDQVVIVGDMPPNTFEEVLNKRISAGYDLFPGTFYQDELAKIAEKGIKIHAFYVRGERAAAAFEEMARATGGRYGPLDIESSDSAAALTDAVCEALLNDAGGTAGAALVDEYKKRFGFRAQTFQG